MKDQDDALMTAKVRLFTAGYVLLGLIALCLVVNIVSGGGLGWRSEKGGERATITVSGKGEESVVPDIAELTFAVLGEGKDVKTAQEEAAKQANAVIDYLKGVGIAEADLKSSYSLSPQYSQIPGGPCQVTTAKFIVVGEIAPCNPTPNRQVITGYEVRQTLQITARDLSKLGELVSEAGKLGVSEINGPYFKVEKEEEIKLTTRAEAIADAEAKAKRLAKDLGVKIVRVQSFNEDGGSIYYAKTTMAESANMVGDSVVPEIPVGGNDIVSNVTIVYEIK